MRICIHCMLDDFCQASEAKLNWGKTLGFWISHVPLPSWNPHVNFMWVLQGSSVQYLGCQIGLDFSMDQLVARVLLTLRKKLIYWSTKQLLFACWIVVVNQVLLSTIWYITSVWVFSRSSMLQVQGLVRNFLSSKNDGSNCRAKVA